jgi:hypothetical protein
MSEIILKMVENKLCPDYVDNPFHRVFLELKEEVRQK